MLFNHPKWSLLTSVIHVSWNSNFSNINQTVSRSKYCQLILLCQFVLHYIPDICLRNLLQMSFHTNSSSLTPTRFSFFKTSSFFSASFFFDTKSAHWHLPILNILDHSLFQLVRILRVWRRSRNCSIWSTFRWELFIHSVVISSSISCFFFILCFDKCHTGSF